MITSYNFTKKDEVNSVSATPLQKFKDEVLTLKGAAITERADQETGEMKKVAILVTDEHGTLTSISGTVINGLDLIIDYMTDMEEEAAQNGVQVKVKSNRSNAGREFLTLELL